jgi:HSP20 family protein
LRGSPWTPAVDIFETETSVVVRLEMAGVRGEDLRVNVDKDVLRIRGLRKTPEVEGVRRLHQMEIAFGPFETSVRLGIPFDREGVSAHLEDGLLEVRLLRRQRVRVEVDSK